jgi:hypothetical protein
MHKKYSIEIVDINTVLIFSSVGYISENIDVSGNLTIDVKWCGY